jgi:hypothetical protein
MSFNALGSEQLKPVFGFGVGGADAFAGSKTSDIVNVSLYGGMYGLIYNVSTTGTMTITVQASSNVSAGATTAIPFYISRTLTSTNVTTAAERVAATGYTTAAGEDATYLITVDLADVQAAGYQYARIVTTEVVDAASTGYCVLLLPNPRYASGALPAAIA